MAKRTKRPLVSYLNLAINVEATDGLPEGQIVVAYITFDRKLCVQFPNGGQEIHTAKRMDEFAGRHGGWVKSQALHGAYDPMDSDLGASLNELVTFMLECGMEPADVRQAILARVDRQLA